MALFQASRKVFAPVRSSVARRFTSLGPREMQQSAKVTPSLDLGLSKKQPAMDLKLEQAANDVQDHFNLANGMQSKVPVEKTIMPMAQVDTLSSLPNDLRITFSTVADLEKYVQLSKTEGGHGREEVLNLFEHFVSGVDGRHACLDVSSWTFSFGENTSEDATVEVAKKITVGEARQQKQPLPGGGLARKVYAEKLFSSIGGNFGRQ